MSFLSDVFEGATTNSGSSGSTPAPLFDLSNVIKLPTVSTAISLSKSTMTAIAALIGVILMFVVFGRKRRH